MVSFWGTVPLSVQTQISDDENDQMFYWFAEECMMDDVFLIFCFFNEAQFSSDGAHLDESV